jgi:hypothetical protein
MPFSARKSAVQRGFADLSSGRDGQGMARARTVKREATRMGFFKKH